MTPLLSVAIITYNQEKTLPQTLDSILTQIHDYPYEIVIGEDCSPDNTKAVIQEYALKYPQIIKPIYNNPNLGLIKNFFNVLSHCSGKYIMECAGDDYWLPGKIKTQIDFIEKHPDTGMCYGKAVLYNDSKNTFGKSIGYNQTRFDKIFMDNPIPALTVCYKNNLAKQYINEINPLEKNWRMEDFPMWLWFAKNSKIKYINKELAVYRVMEESESHSNNAEKRKLYEDSLLNIRKFFSEKYQKDELLKKFEISSHFYNAWLEKNSKDAKLYGKQLLHYKFSFKTLLKLIILSVRK